MTEFTREDGKYPIKQSRHSSKDRNESSIASSFPKLKAKPGICIPWEEKRKELPRISGDENILKRIWEEIESYGYSFIWQILLSF